MRALVCRVNSASVTVLDKTIGQINQGLLVYLGVSHSDTNKIADKMIAKLKNLRIFEDQNGKMNLNINDVNGSYLIVSQFTLYGDTKSNNRPSFTQAAAPLLATEIYQYIIDQLKKDYNCQTGQFGAHMIVNSINDGPVNIFIEID